jgi:hypothetical protein
MYHHFAFPLILLLLRRLLLSLGCMELMPLVALLEAASALSLLAWLCG